MSECSRARRAVNELCSSAARGLDEDSVNEVSAAILSESAGEFQFQGRVFRKPASVGTATFISVWGMHKQERKFFTNPEYVLTLNPRALVCGGQAAIQYRP